MITLDTTTLSLEAILTANVSVSQLHCYVAYSDDSNSDYAAASKRTLTNNTTAVTICAAPGAGVLRDIALVNIYNADNAAASVIVRLNDNGTLYDCYNVVIQPGNTLTYVHGSGWATTNINGGQVYSLPNVTAALASNILTATLTAPFTTAFRNATLTAGGFTQSFIATTLSLPIPALASLGAVTGVQATLGLALAYNAGVPVLMVANLSGGLDMSETGVVSPTTISGTATANNVWYSASAVAANSPYRMVGVIEATWTSGTGWTSIALVQGVAGEAFAAQSTQYNLGSTLLFSSMAPTLGTGWGTSPSIIANGSPTFRINVGTGTTASSGVINMPAAANGWNAIIQVFKPAGTSSPTQTTYVSASTTTSISVYNLSNSNGSSVAWPAGTVLIISAEAY